MALYYYNKYQADSNTGYENYQEGSLEYQGVTSSPATNTGYTLGSFYDTTPFSVYYWAGEISETVGDGYNSSSLLSPSYSNTSRTVMYYLYDSGNDNVQVYRRIDTCDSYTYYTQGSYIETLVAEDGTYPDDGKSGSYWYVKGELAILPTISTGVADNITYEGARLKGNVTDEGSETPDIYIEWGEVVTDHSEYIGAYGIGEYLKSISGLDPNTTYYYRIKAVTSWDTVYGDTESLTTLEMPLPAPTERTPANDYESTDTTPYFEMVLTEETENYATHYHARLRIAENAGMSGATVYESKEETGTWEYWNGSSWVAMPETGVVPNTKVRCAITSPLSYRTDYYWDCASHDGDIYGFDSSVRHLRAVLTIDGDYVLNINGTDYEVVGDSALEVYEATNGTIGAITAIIDNVDGTAYSTISDNDVVIVALNDEYGNTEEFGGYVKERIPRGDTMTVIANLGGIKLSERLVSKTYSSQDIGLILKDIIDTYCTPLTSTGIDTSLGGSVPYTGNYKTPLAIFEDLRRQFNFLYYVDEDNVVNVYNEADMDTATWKIQYGE